MREVKPSMNGDNAGEVCGLKGNDRVVGGVVPWQHESREGRGYHNFGWGRADVFVEFYV